MTGAAGRLSLAAACTALTAWLATPAPAEAPVKPEAAAPSAAPPAPAPASPPQPGPAPVSPAAPPPQGPPAPAAPDKAPAASTNEPPRSSEGAPAAQAPAAEQAAPETKPAEPGKEHPPAVLAPIPDEVNGILGEPVRGPAGEDLGMIVDVLIDAEGRPRAAVIDFGGFLGVGSRKIAVDWQALNFRPADRPQRAQISLGRAELQAAPEYKPKAQPAAVVKTVERPPAESPPPEQPPAESSPPAAAPASERPAPAEAVPHPVPRPPRAPDGL